MTAQVQLLRKYVPSLTVEDIEPNTYMAGIRAQALDEDGSEQFTILHLEVNYFLLHR